VSQRTLLTCVRTLAFHDRIWRFLLKIVCRFVSLTLWQYRRVLTTGCNLISYFANNICCFANSNNWRKVMTWQLFGGNFSSLNNRHNVYEGKLNRWKVIVLGDSFMKILLLLTYDESSNILVVLRCQIVSLVELNRSVYVASENRSNGWKLFLRYFFMKVSQLFPLNEIWNIFMVPHSSGCRARPKSISMLLVKIGRTVQKLLLG
jgi:hypothetical protein